MGAGGRSGPVQGWAPDGGADQWSAGRAGQWIDRLLHSRSNSRAVAASLGTPRELRDSLGTRDPLKPGTWEP